MPAPQKDLTSAMLAHFDALKRQDMEVFGLPPHPYEPVIIYFDPMSLEERAAIDMEGDTWPVDILLLKAEDADGNKLFDAHSRPKLMKKASPYLVMKVANRILAADAVDPETLNRIVDEGKRDGSLLAAVYDMAENLGKTAGEIMRLPVAEFAAWHRRFEQRMKKDAAE